MSLVIAIFLFILLLPFSHISAQTSPSTTLSTSTSTESLILDLQAQIKALQTRINELETELGVKPAAPASPEATQPSSETSAGTAQDKQIPVPSIQFPTFTATLSLGSRGDDVRNLQQFLAQFPNLYPEGLITGYYGPLTEKAVQRWQEKEGIVSSGTSDTTGYGRIGPKTRARLNDLAVKPPSKSKKVIICHIPPDNQENKQTLEIAEPALKAHLAHGDYEGACVPPPLSTAPSTGLPDGQAGLGQATTTPSAIATSTPSGTITATPAQPIGQTGTTTVLATPATPAQTSGGTTPPPTPSPAPSPTPSPSPSPAPSPTPPPSTTTTTPPTSPPPPPPPPSSSLIDFALVYITPQVTVTQGGIAIVIIHAVPVPGALFPYVRTDLVGITGGSGVSSGGGRSSSCVDDQDNPISCAQPKKVILTETFDIKSNAPPGSYTITGLASDKLYPLSWPPGEAVIKNISVPLTIVASSSAIYTKQSNLALILQSLSATLDDIQKQIQKLAR